MFTMLWVLLFVFSAAWASNDRCGTRTPPRGLVATHQHLASRQTLQLRRRQELPPIELYVHVVETEENAGKLEEDLLSKQLNVIFESFGQYGISFEYKGVDYTVDDAWSKGLDDDEMIPTLRNGSYAALNLYIQEDIPGSLGVCTFPQGSIPYQILNLTAGDFELDRPDFAHTDGCQIAQYTLPGRFAPDGDDGRNSTANNDKQLGQFAGNATDEMFLGLTAVHEIGHWMGLLHTFEGESCSGPGDLIADTRQQSRRTSLCPRRKISCRNLTFSQPPEDPFHNYMDYSTDNCMTEFTPIQAQRMKDIFELYRLGNTSVSSTSSVFAPSNPTQSSPTRTHEPVVTAAAGASNTIPSANGQLVGSQPHTNPDIVGTKSVIQMDLGTNSVMMDSENDLSDAQPGVSLGTQGRTDAQPESDSDAQEENSHDNLSDAPGRKHSDGPQGPINPQGNQGQIGQSVRGPGQEPPFTSSTENPLLPTSTPWNHTVTAYYGSGNIDIFPPSKIPWTKITHLCYAFAKTQDPALNASVVLNETLLEVLSRNASRYGVNLMLSVGGYGEGGRFFSDIVQSNVSINAFVAAFQSLVQRYHLAGIDIDWEFVGAIPPEYGISRATDFEGYLALLQALRSSMPGLQISAAVPTFLFNNAAENMHLLEPYFDRINLMLYDLWNEVGLAGPNAPLDGVQSTYAPVDNTTTAEDAAGSYPYDNGDEADRSTEEQNTCVQGIKTWRDAGFPLEKLVFGVPFYGYGYSLLNTSSPAELYTDVRGKSRGDSNEDPRGTSGFWKWRNLRSQNVVVPQSNGSYGAGPGWQRGFDEISKTPFVWSLNRSEIISYDDPDSLRVKREYARRQGMNGMMFWAMYGDTDDAELTQVLHASEFN